MPVPANFEDALYAILAAHVGTAALVGTRIYPVRAPKAYVDPYITYEQTFGETDQSHDSTTGLTDSDWVIRCTGSTYAKAKEVALNVQAALHGYKGTIGGVYVQFCKASIREDDFGSTTKNHTKIVDVSAIY